MMTEEHFMRLPAWAKKAHDAGVDGLDIMHSHLQCLLAEATQNEGDRPDDPYARGVADTLAELYRVTYALSLRERTA